MNIRLRFDACLIDRREILETLRSVLQECAPEWARDLNAYSTRVRLDVGSPSGFCEGLLLEATRRGELYKALEARFGPPRAKRVCGSVELRGSSPALTVFVDVDEWRLAQFGKDPSGKDHFIWGNQIGLHVSRRQVDGVDAFQWSRDVFRRMCAAPGLAHGTAHLTEEFDAKNMRRDESGSEALGVNVACGLPGLYWRNAFGEPYTSLIGRDVLRSAPAPIVEQVGDVVVLGIHDDPRKWNTPAYQQTERAILEHIGPQYFFSREEPDRQLVAPDFGLSTSGA